MDDDLKSASNSMEQEHPTAYRPKKPKPERDHRKMLKIIGVIIAVLLVGFGVWKLVLNKSKDAAPTTSTTTPQTTQTTPEAAGNDVPDAALTETFTSTPLSLSFKYPKTWKATETADNGIRVDSPSFNYLPAQAASLDGNFRIYIRQGARTVDGKYIGSGLAIKASEKLAYTRPANDQRADTWLSSFGYDSPNIFSFFMIAGNFELKMNDTLGPDYGKEPDTYIIVGGYSSSTAADDLAMNSVTLEYYATTRAYKQALQIIASLQLN